MAHLLCKSHHAEFQAKCSPFMAQRPHRALLQKNSLLNWSPWSSNWSSGIKYQSSAKSLRPSLSLPFGAASSCRGDFNVPRAAHTPGTGFDCGGNSSESWMFQRTAREVRAARPGVSKQVVTDICLQQRRRPPQPAASGRIVSGGSWEPQNRFGLTLAAWRPETPKVGVGVDTAALPNLP